MTPHLTRPKRAALAAALLGALLLCLPSAAPAQTAPAPAAQAAPAAPVIPRVEARIKSLHRTLRITAAQEPQWQAVAAVMRDNANAMHALIEERLGKGKTMAAIDDLLSYEAIAEAHAAGVKKLLSAFEPLYASLSDAQKKRADALFRPHIVKPSS